MAPQRSDQRFLAVRAKAASARGFLALAVGILTLALVVGCGGGSDGQDASAPAATGSSSAKQEAQKAPSKAKESSAAGGSGSAQGNSSQEGQKNSQSSHKQGQGIAVPKGSPEPEPTPEEKAQATVANIALSSPSLATADSEVVLPATYTCDGKNSWPPLAWQGIPSGTTELTLFVMNLQPVGGKLFFDWAVAGLDPSLDHMDAGRLPKGAVVGENSSGKISYSLCPPGSAESYIFALYALPRALKPHRGFEPHALREAVLESSGNAGIMAASYTR